VTLTATRGDVETGGFGIAEPPLKGIRIIAAEQYGAGPFATMYLSDMGAEVIKIEPPKTDKGAGGDSSRQSGPYFLGPDDSQFFQTFNLGKKSLTLDLRKPEGQAVLHRLVAGADAVLNNLRGDQPAKLGLTHAALARIKPSIVCAHLSGYGREGERAHWPAYDYLMQAEAGFLSLTGEPDGAPTRMGLSIVDYLTGITTAFALTAALLGAARTGRGRDVDVTLYDVAMHQLTYPATWYLNEGIETTRRPRSGHPSVVPCETFPTRDGRIFIMCILPKFWEKLCHLTGLPELLDDPRFQTNKARYENRDALIPLLDAALSTRPTGEWMARFAGQIPAAPVLTVGSALDNPYFRATGGVQSVDHSAHPGFQVLSNPIRLDGSRAQARPGPSLGEHTDGLLAELGYAPAEIAALRASGTI
jgi:succinate--hydroxymethylglutarate CoA-transferase